MTATRTYGDPCGIARALDVIGERWALLIVRELNLGPKRFTDLRAGLPTASPNVLTQRLRDLEEAGVIHHRRLTAPGRVQVYELTDWGQALEPVLLALGRWGSRSPARHQRQLSVDALILALKTNFDAGKAKAVDLRLGLTLGGDEFTLTIENGELSVARQPPQHPMVTISTDVGSLRRLVFGDGDLASAVDTGKMKITGDTRSVEQFVGLFGLASARNPPHLAPKMA